MRRKKKKTAPAPATSDPYCLLVSGTYVLLCNGSHDEVYVVVVVVVVLTLPRVVIKSVVLRKVLVGY